METILHDLRLAVRLLWKDKGFAVTTLVTLALCIGANTALFSVVDSVLLRPLPVPESDRLVLIYNSYPKAGADRGGSGVPDYFDRVRGVRGLEAHALIAQRSMNIGEAGRPERVDGMQVTPSFFRLGRVKPLLGRGFTEDEGEPGHEQKAVLSYALWQEQFGGDSRAIGRELRINGRPHTVVGVMPKEFLFVGPETRLWTPLAFTAQQKSDEARHNNSWESIGRLAPGATIAHVQAQVDAVNAVSVDRLPAIKPLLINAGFHTVVTGLQDDMVRNVRSTLYLLWGAPSSSC